MCLEHPSKQLRDVWLCVPWRALRLKLGLCGSSCPRECQCVECCDARAHCCKTQACSVTQVCRVLFAHAPLLRDACLCPKSRQPPKLSHRSVGKACLRMLQVICSGRLRQQLLQRLGWCYLMSCMLSTDLQQVVVETLLAFAVLAEPVWDIS